MYNMTAEDLKTETWKPIIIEKNGITYDYTGLYEVSDKGRVMSLNYKRTGRSQILKPGENTDGYLCVKLTKNKEQEQFTIHRLVAYAFIPNYENLPEINHLDENKHNNRVENLEYCNRLHNVTYGERSQKQSDTMRKPVICLETMRIYKSTLEAGEIMGFEDGMNLQAQVSRSCSNKTHKTTCKTFHFMFLEDFKREHNLSESNIGRLHNYDYASKFICWDNPYVFTLDDEE